MEDKDTEQSYWASVKQKAADAWESAEHDIDAARDALHEACDGSYWVIYYHAAALALKHSRNDDAIFDCYGDAGEAFAGCDSMGAINCRAAFYAYLADCEEALQELAEAEGDET